jgi:hypothetical protein
MTEMRVILEGIGYVTLDIDSERERSMTGGYWNMVGHMLNGGSRNKSVDYYIDKVESYEGREISGRITEGPAHKIGEYVNQATFETDIDRLEAIASGLDFRDGPYPEEG